MIQEKIYRKGNFIRGFLLLQLIVKNDKRLALFILVPIWACRGCELGLEVVCIAKRGCSYFLGPIIHAKYFHKMDKN